MAYLSPLSRDKALFRRSKRYWSHRAYRSVLWIFVLASVSLLASAYIFLFYPKVAVLHFHPADGLWQSLHLTRRFATDQSFPDFFSYLGFGPYLRYPFWTEDASHIRISYFIAYRNVWAFLSLSLALCFGFWAVRLRKVYWPLLILIGFSVYLWGVPPFQWFEAGLSNRPTRMLGTVLAAIMSFVIRKHGLHPVVEKSTLGIIVGLLLIWSPETGIAILLSIGFLCGMMDLVQAWSRMSWKSLFYVGSLYALYVGIALGTGGLLLQLSTGSLWEYLRVEYTELAPNQFWFWDRFRYKALSWPLVLGLAVFNLTFSAFLFLRGNPRIQSLSIFLSAQLWVAWVYLVSSRSNASMYHGLFCFALLFPWTLLLQSKHKQWKQLFVLGAFLFWGVSALYHYQQSREAYQTRQAYSSELQMPMDRFVHEIHFLSQRWQQLYQKPHISTYASAMDYIANTFSVGPVDLLFHAIGPSLQSNMIHDLQNPETTFVEVLSWDLQIMQYWDFRAQWWFYRHVFQAFQAVDRGPYVGIYARASHSQTLAYQNATLTMHTNQMQQVEITVDIPEAQGGEWIADVAITYHSDVPYPIASSRIELLDAYTKQSDWVVGLPLEATNRFIPILLDKQGHGTITLAESPQGSPPVHVEQAQLQKVIRHPLANQAFVPPQSMRAYKQTSYRIRKQSVYPYRENYLYYEVEVPIPYVDLGAARAIQIHQRYYRVIQSFTKNATSSIIAFTVPEEVVLTPQLSIVTAQYDR